MTKRGLIVLAGYLVRCPLGGYAWQAAHYLIGLAGLGYEVWFYEDTGYFAPAFNPAVNGFGMDYGYGVRAAARFFAGLGLGERWVFVDTEQGREYGPGAGRVEELFREADVVVNLGLLNHRSLENLSGRPSVYIDLDPAYTQIRLVNGDAYLKSVLDRHTHLFTIGENIGTPRSPVPTGGYTWHATRQPVVPELWAVADCAGSSYQAVEKRPSAAFPSSRAVQRTPTYASRLEITEALHPDIFEQPEPEPFSTGSYTTIGQWRSQGRDLTYRGEQFRWCKRTEWLRFLDLPARTVASLEMAMNVESVAGDPELLAAKGWQVVDPLRVSIDPWRYRDYIRGSRGEFTAAKDMNIRLRSGWFSDRTACYLAAGRPVVVQDTGFADILPLGPGLHAFGTVEEAAHGLNTIEADYGRAARYALEVAQEYFAAGKVLASLLGKVGF